MENKKISLEKKTQEKIENLAGSEMVRFQEEFEEIKNGRTRYREIIGNVSYIYLDVAMTGDIQLSVNVKRIIDDIIYEYKDAKKERIQLLG